MILSLMLTESAVIVVSLDISTWTGTTPEAVHNVTALESLHVVSAPTSEFKWYADHCSLVQIPQFRTTFYHNRLLFLLIFRLDCATARLAGVRHFGTKGYSSIRGGWYSYCS